MTVSQPSPNDEDNNKQPVKQNVATEVPKEPPLTVVPGEREFVQIDPPNKEDLSKRDVSKNPINYAIDSTEDEFKPSKLSRLRKFVLDEVTRHFNIDPVGEDYILIVATSADKGQSFKVVADSTEEQNYIGQEVWAKRMVEKEVRNMKLKEDELINQAKQILKQEESGQR